MGGDDCGKDASPEQFDDTAERVVRLTFRRVAYCEPLAEGEIALAIGILEYFASTGHRGY